MSERKVLNKYFPPNFDPSQIPRQKRPKDLQHKVRLMAPFSMRCESCGEYIYKGKKFNARKETVEGEVYLSIKIFRFYIRCPRCSAEITFKTDPKNTDYVAEHGASRNFEPWRQNKDDENVEEEEERGNDPMQALENRTLDSKREMEILDALDEIRLRNARSARMDVDEVLARFSSEDKERIRERLQEEYKEDEETAIAAFQSGDGERVRKLADDKEPDPVTLVTQVSSAAFKIPSFNAIANKRKTTEDKPSLGISIKRKKPEADAPPPASSSKASTTPSKGSALTLLSAYADDDSSDSDDST